MRTVPRLASRSGCAEDHVLAEGDEQASASFSPISRGGTIQRQHVDAETRLQLGEAED